MPFLDREYEHFVGYTDKHHVFECVDTEVDSSPAFQPCIWLWKLCFVSSSRQDDYFIPKRMEAEPSDCWRAMVYPDMQAAATAEYRQKEGDAETTASGEEDEPVSEEDALDIQELLKKAITSSAV